MMNILGIDPGLSGGIAYLTDGLAIAHTMPATEHDLWDLLHDRADTVAFIEKVGVRPFERARASFTFGKGYGALLMGLTAAGIPFTEVAPGTWQRSMGCLTHGDKNVSKRRAQQLFPRMHITHKTADALLIAAYGWQQTNNAPWAERQSHHHVGASV